MSLLAGVFLRGFTRIQGQKELESIGVSLVKGIRVFTRIIRCLTRKLSGLDSHRFGVSLA